MLQSSDSWNGEENGVVRGIFKEDDVVKIQAFIQNTADAIRPKDG